jgi:hypothetical protein
MMLLATYMKKNKWDFEKGENGLLALEAFQNRPGGFDVIFMGKHLFPFAFPNNQIARSPILLPPQEIKLF